MLPINDLKFHVAAIAIGLVNRILRLIDSMPMLMLDIRMIAVNEDGELSFSKFQTLRIYNVTSK